jgi:tRNA(Ile)-lysidine synthase
MPEHELNHGELDDALAGLLDAPHWYVAFSGGLDSTVLLHLLHRWCKAHTDAPPLTAIHVNHGLQAAADDWQLHCEWLCKMLRIPVLCCLASVDAQGKGIEAAARDVRYKIFEQQLEAGAVLFQGHHLDDQVETFFLRLLRGAGVQGLAAMPATRPLGAGQLVRPLLGLPRSRLETYAGEQGLQWVEDPSNEDTRMDRNFLRAQLLPLLASRWPGYRQTVGRAGEHIAGAAALLAQLLPRPITVHSVMGDPGVPLAELFAAAPEGASLRLRHWLRAMGLPAPDQALLDEFLRQLREAGPESKPSLHCSAYTLQRYREAIYLLPDAVGHGACEPFRLGPGEVYQLPGAGQLGLEAATTVGLSLAPDERLQVSWRQGGERCRPQGRAGSASLKKLLQERAVPPWWRDRLPLLYLEDELLAVAGLWLCESSRLAGAAEAGRSLWRPRWQSNIHAAFD